jgi:diaminohydroxyphosphoribosylaminopyrimidine deaminase / 5-amino-6-(5-phosphoribosylamino)uracil reductase
MMQDEDYIRQCFDLALKGKWWVAPNPMVGAVIVADNRVIGIGWHQAYGQAHAEVNAFAAVAEADKALLPEATLYCSLEPCFHFGKTPPCVDLVLKHGVKRVVISNLDPNPLVAGQSVAKLRAHGVVVVSGVLASEGAELNAVFFHHIQQKLPFITLKWAQSSDGFLGRVGERTAISSPSMLPVVHGWRAEHAAILVGTETAMVDNPRLDIRFFDSPDLQRPLEPPKRFVIDFSERIPTTHHLLSDALPTWVIGRKSREFEQHNKYSWVLPDGPTLWPQLFQRMYEELKISSVLVEGGAQVHQQLLDLDWFNQVYVIQSETTIDSGVPAPILMELAVQLKNSYKIAYDRIFHFTRK